MKITLTKQIVDCLIKGSSIYSTGGGLEHKVQKKIFKKVLKSKNTSSLINRDELNTEDYICAVYALGSAGNTDFDLSQQFKIGIKVLGDYFKNKFSAIFAGETNIDAFVFQVASNIGLPVLDADCTGGRAVPEIRFDNFAIFKKNPLPLVAVTPDEKVVILDKSSGFLAIEKSIRKLLATSGPGLIAVLDHAIQVKDAKNLLTEGIFRRAIKTGKFIEQNRMVKKNIDNFLAFIDAKKILQGKIIKNNIRNDPKTGFIEGYYFVEDKEGNRLKIYVKNENLICWLNDKVFLTPPDSILCIDPLSLTGIHNSRLEEGQSVVVAGRKAPKMWRSSKAKALFHPKKLGFNTPSILLK